LSLGGGHKPASLLLLFGTSRSGTSWLGKILDSHPQTLYKHEPDRANFGIPFAPAVDQHERYRKQVHDFVARLRSNNTAHCSARLPVFRKQYRSSISQSIHHFSVVVSGAGSSLGWSLPVWQCADVNSHPVRLVWKSTDSLGRIGVIVRNLDDYRAVRIIRHPCGFIASVLRGEAQGKFVASVRMSDDYGVMEALLKATRSRARGLTVDHLRALHPIERMAWIWVLLNEKAEDDTRDNPHCTSICYEDICRDPMNQIRSLFSFLGLEWSAQTEQFIQVSTLKSQPGGFDRIAQDSQRYYSVFKDPLEAAEKWKSEMKAEDLERVFQIVRQSDLFQLYPDMERALVS
jgi:hypothetical protein